MKHNLTLLISTLSILLLTLAGCNTITQPQVDIERNYVGDDPDLCSRMKFGCDPGWNAFFDETGCGCEWTLTHCSERQTSCPKNVDPVCGWFDESVQCIKAPCANEYNNACFACADAQVKGWTLGSCE